MKKLVFGEPKFSDREKRVFRLFWAGGIGKDIPIDTMFKKYMRGDEEVERRAACFTPRERQMSIGMVVTRINRKLKGTKIVPGALKRTYRLTFVD